MSHHQCIWKLVCIINWLANRINIKKLQYKTSKITITGNPDPRINPVESKYACSDRRPPVVVDTIHHSVVLLYFIFLRVQSSRFVLYI